MIQKISRRQFLILMGMTGVGAMTGRISFATNSEPARFYFGVMSDPHGMTDSWVNALTELRDLKVNPPPEYGRAAFLLVAGDTNPIDRRNEDYLSVFKDKDAPYFLPVIGNHEADDTGGFPGGMGMMGAGAGQPGGGSPPGGQPGQGIQPGMGQAPSGQQGQGGQAGLGQLPGGQSGQGGGGMNANDGNPAIIDMEFIRDKLIPALPNVVRMSATSCTYYWDYKNVRVISIDGYSGEAGTGGVINEKGRNWTEKAIASAPSTVDHIFVSFHAPAFPRVRHTQDSFNADPEQRNAFWNMLIAHKDKVRAVFCGHTHSYCRMRVLDPAGADANDFSKYPDEAGGIYQINDGSTGMGMKNTFVRVAIDGKKVSFRAYEADNGKDKPFAVKEEWTIV